MPCCASSAARALACRGVGHEHQRLVTRRGLQADAPQGVEVAFDRVPRRCARQPVVMGEARSPQPVRAIEMACDAVARTQQAREPRAARMLGQVHDQVVMARAQASTAARTSAPACADESLTLPVRDRSCARDRSPDDRRASPRFPRTPARRFRAAGAACAEHGEHRRGRAARRRDGEAWRRARGGRDQGRRGPAAGSACRQDSKMRCSIQTREPSPVRAYSLVQRRACSIRNSFEYNRGNP